MNEVLIVRPHRDSGYRCLNMAEHRVNSALMIQCSECDKWLAYDEFRSGECEGKEAKDGPATDS